MAVQLDWFTGHPDGIGGSFYPATPYETGSWAKETNPAKIYDPTRQPSSLKLTAGVSQSIGIRSMKVLCNPALIVADVVAISDVGTEGLLYVEFVWWTADGTTIVGTNAIAPYKPATTWLEAQNPPTFQCPVGAAAIQVNITWAGGSPNGGSVYLRPLVLAGLGEALR